jgi:hypothetical protein
MISSYKFGRMVISTKVYTSDLIIYPNGDIDDTWWRKNGHSLCIDDITELIESRPEKIIVGTGANGLLKPQELLIKQLKETGIELKTAPTSQAVQLYNESITKQENVAACFHLSC